MLGMVTKVRIGNKSHYRQQRSDSIGNKGYDNKGQHK